MTKTAHKTLDSYVIRHSKAIYAASLLLFLGAMLGVTNYAYHRKGKEAGYDVFTKSGQTICSSGERFLQEAYAYNGMKFESTPVFPPKNQLGTEIYLSIGKRSFERGVQSAYQEYCLPSEKE